MRAASFNDLVGACEERRRHYESECFGSLEIDSEVKLGRKLDWQVRRLGTIEYLPHIATPQTIDFHKIWPIAQHSAGFDKLTPLEGCRQPMARSESHNQVAVA